MASSQGGRRSFWRSDALAALLVIAVVLGLQIGTDAFGGLERRFYDSASTRHDLAPSDRIAVIAIDDTSIANLGRWPWSREVHAQLIDRLTEAGARTIVYTALFLEPQTDRGLETLRSLRQRLAGRDEPLAAELRPELERAEASLDGDARLADSLRRSGRVLLPGLFTLGTPQGRPDGDWPAFAQRSAASAAAGLGLPAETVQWPIAPLAEAAAGVAHLNPWQDADATLRREPLLIAHHGRSLPALSLRAAAHSLNLGSADLLPQPDGGLQLGRLRVPADERQLTLPRFYPVRDGKAPFTVDSFYDVVSGKLDVRKYAGKIVLVGATAAGVGVLFPTPVSPAMAPVETMAHITSSILGGHFVAQPGWGLAASLGALLVVSLWLLFGLPRLRAGHAALGTGGLLVALLGTEFVLLSQAALWVPLTLAATLLVIGHGALTTRRFLATEAGKLRSDEESAETNRLMALALQGQGQLDMAFDRFQRVPPGGALMDNLMHLALDFERKRQFNKAQAVYEHMARHDAGYKDLQARLARARQLSETVMLGGGGTHPGGTLLLDGGAVEKPMLGRYQVEKELGKGAMGIVYQGRDPKIGRVVAIKTLALGDEFEGDALADARERFFREAETAGRLQHPNIVTIFDAGEEHDLAYIAMEFLRGKDLTEHTRVDQLLPVERVVSIAARVAEALDYAHRHHVVHRDIKPANIMYEPGSDTVKVTDFGIARVTDASKTKTGMVLGTPSFMSPEQLAGKKVDGRADLYSLGVMLFQLLSGVLPFRGDSMAALMFKIANEPAPDVRELRPELPAALAEVVARALAKNPAQRFPSGNTFALALRASLDAPAGAVASVSAPAAAPSVHNATSTDRPTDPPAAADPFQRTTVLDPQDTIPRHP